MKEEKLFETMADINENYVADAHKKPNKKSDFLDEMGGCSSMLMRCYSWSYCNS